MVNGGFKSHEKYFKQNSPAGREGILTNSKLLIHINENLYRKRNDRTTISAINCFLVSH